MLDKLVRHEQLQDYFERFKTYVLSLRDVRNVGMLAFLVLVVLVSWSGARAVQTNYGLQKQVYRLSQANEVKRLENANLALTNNYYNTSQYLEVTARQNLGLAASGETELLISKDAAMGHTVQMAGSEQQSTAAKDLPFWQKNFRAWMDFFLHRSST